MPEGDSVFRAAAQLHAALAGRQLISSDFRVPRFATLKLDGWTVDEVVPRGKHLLMRVEGPAKPDGASPAEPDRLTIHSHLKMEGTWQVYPPGGRWRKPGFTARCVLRTAAADAVGFSLGILEVVRTVRGGHRRGPPWPGPAGSRLGPGRGGAADPRRAGRPHRRRTAGPAQPRGDRQHLPLRGLLPLGRAPGVARLGRHRRGCHDHRCQAPAGGQPGPRAPDHRPEPARRCRGPDRRAARLLGLPPRTPALPEMRDPHAPRCPRQGRRQRRNGTSTTAPRASRCRDRPRHNLRRCRTAQGSAAAAA